MNPARTMCPARALLVGAFLFFLCGPRAFAHQPEMSSLYLDASGDHVTMVLRYMPANLDAYPRARSKADAAQSVLKTLGPHWLEIAATPDSPFQPVILPAGDIEFLEDEQQCEWQTGIPLPPEGRWRVRLVQLGKLGSAHSEYVTAAMNGRTVAKGLLTAAEPELMIDWGTERAGAAVQTEVHPEKPPVTAGGGLFVRFLKMGVWHILTGYDHLLYLGGLILGCRKLKPLLWIITSFTLAHSITLALATTGVVNVSPKMVEPAIAASIVFIAVENIFRRGRPPFCRWLVAFGFGLIHGLGFSSALTDLGLGTDLGTLAMPLVSFNLGVEAGQMIVLAPVVPLLFWARKRLKHDLRIELALSAVIALAGAYWFSERVLGFGLG